MIDLNNCTEVLDAAKPFDKSYVPGRGVVMIAGQEIVCFARHVAEDQGLRVTPGRRSSDHEMDELRRINTEQLARIQYLENALALAEARINRDIDKRSADISGLPG